MVQKYINFKRPDDWHVHLREGDMLSRVLPFTFKNFGSALVMPNLHKPVTNLLSAQSYYKTICKNIPKDAKFTPHMTIYLTKQLNKAEIKELSNHDYVKAIKMYPRGATTNSESGVLDFTDFYSSFEQMEKSKVVLSIHGEVTDEKIDIFDREKVFIEKVLIEIIKRFPDLKIVLEHITSAEAVNFVNDQNNLAATITVHHLLVNRNAMLSKGIRPDFYCAPILKTESDRLALVSAAISANEKFFLGTDSAPHLERDKISSCGCAGVFNSPLAIPLLLHLFEEYNSLDTIEKFLSINGRKFYGINQQEQTVRYVKRSIPINPIKDIQTKEGKVIVFNPKKALYWEKLS